MLYQCKQCAEIFESAAEPERCKICGSKLWDKEKVKGVHVFTRKERFVKKTEEKPLETGDDVLVL